MPALTEAHLKSMREWFEPLGTFMKEEDGKAFFEEREKRSSRYQGAFSPDSLEKLALVEMGSLIGDLWANEMWSDTSQPLNRILVHISYPEFQKQLKELLWGRDRLAARYDHFRNSVKGMGPAMTTELLTLVHPDGAAIWNHRAREAIRGMKLESIFPTLQYAITGSQYQGIIDGMVAISGFLKSVEMPIRLENLLDVDYFLHFVSTHQTIAKGGSGPSVRQEVAPGYEFDHDEVRDALNELGIGLGFESETEVQIAKGAQLDVLWKAKISNLGVVKYAFEVHSHGSIDSLVLNLMKAKDSDPAIQRIVAVSNTKLLEAIKAEISPLREDFRQSMAFMEASEALKASEHMKGAKEILDKLQLVRRETQARPEL